MPGSKVCNAHGSVLQTYSSLDQQSLFLIQSRPMHALLIDSVKKTTPRARDCIFCKPFSHRSNEAISLCVSLDMEVNSVRRSKSNPTFDISETREQSFRRKQADDLLIRETKFVNLADSLDILHACRSRASITLHLVGKIREIYRMRRGEEFRPI